MCIHTTRGVKKKIERVYYSLVHCQQRAGSRQRVEIEIEIEIDYGAVLIIIMPFYAYRYDLLLCL